MAATATGTLSGLIGFFFTSCLSLLGETFVLGSYVRELTDATLDSAITDTTLGDKEDSMMIMFFAPWSDHCQVLEPEYEEAARMLSDDGQAVPLTIRAALISASSGG